MSKKQSIVALSTAEAEYIAMAKVSQAVSHSKFFLEFTLSEKINGPIEIRGDNKASISIIDKPTTVHDRVDTYKRSITMSESVLPTERSISDGLQVERTSQTFSLRL